MNDTPHEEEQNNPRIDPRRRLLGNLTTQQRYVLYVVLALGVLVVLYLEVFAR